MRITPKAFVLGAIVGLAPAVTLALQDQPLLQAEALLQAGDPNGALGLVESVLAAPEPSARAYLLRSTARFMLGLRELAVEDLDRALELDPRLRQGWLNRGALALSERRYEEAHQAFLAAQKLDPRADDNPLNLGVSLVFLGRIDDAKALFSTYIAGHDSAAEAHATVAKNFALGGYKTLALEHLESAIELDERQRLLAKTDPAFEDLLGTVRFQRLLSFDGFEPPPGSLTATRAFDAGYEGGRGPLLGAVIDALGKLAIPMDPRIEVTPDWALLWADLRIKVRPGKGGQGIVELSAPPGRFDERDWLSRVDRLADQIRYQLTPKVPAVISGRNGRDGGPR